MSCVSARPGWRSRPPDPASTVGAIRRIADQLGVHPEALRTWAKKAETDAGDRPGTTTSDAEHLAALERENRELRRANQILKSRGESLRGGAGPSVAMKVAFVDSHTAQLPAATTVWRLLIRLDAGVLSQVLARWLRYQAGPVVIAGRRWCLWSPLTGRSPALLSGRQVHLLPAYDTSTGIVVAEVQITAK